MAAIDENAYATGIKVADEELAAIALKRNAFHGEWNDQFSLRNQHVASRLFELRLLDT